MPSYNNALPPRRDNSVYAFVTKAKRAAIKDPKLIAAIEKRRATLHHKRQVALASRARRTAELVALKEERLAKQIHLEKAHGQKLKAGTCAATQIECGPQSSNTITPLETRVDNTTTAPPNARAAPTTRTKCIMPKPLTLHEVKTCEKYNMRSHGVPDAQELSASAMTNVLFCDKHGIGIWGDRANSWRSPLGWTDCINRLNAIAMLTTTNSNVQIMSGEYNNVFFFNDNDLDWLPPLMDRDGNRVNATDVVFRLTRPDVVRQGRKDKFFRYKTLVNTTTEMCYTAHATVHGVAPSCYAIVLFESGHTLSHNCSTNSTKLYGTLYVMKRATMSMSELLERQCARLNSSVPLAPVSMSPHTENTPLLQNTLQMIGYRLARKIARLVVCYSKLGVLNFDVKPGNILLSSDVVSVAQAIDFDAAMYVIRPGGADAVSSEWCANTLVNLLLLSAHIRCFRSPSVCDGWVVAIRPLLLQLIMPARSTLWPFLAKVDLDAQFSEILASDDKACMRKLEMMSTLYFVKSQNTIGTRFVPCAEPNAPGLVHQLVRYVLHGSAHKHDDREIETKFGNYR
tara:strand:+ start:1585 stop:3294 length:1710 start_codon:yes stop_codon:yes gene_type:complete